MEKFDIGIIGAGPAGLSAASMLQEAGKKVVILEEYLWGGTCPNYGCDPKKILLAAVEAKELADQMRLVGVVGEEKINWPDLMTHKMAYTTPIPSRKIASLDMAGIAHRYGHATFTDSHTVQCGDHTILADTWIIATGARPRRLNIPGDELLEDNEDFLNLETMPDEIALIGGGFIAIEFAAIARAAGATVHILVHNETILRGFDQKMAGTLVEQMEAKGIQFHWNFESSHVKKTANGLLLVDQSGHELGVERAFLAAGRQANDDHLNLEAIGVELGHNGIQVGEDLRTTVDHVFAIGDVADSPVAKLTPTGSFEGRYVAGLLLGMEPSVIKYPAIPEVVYGVPKFGQVGLSVIQAEKRGYTIHEIDMTNWQSYWRHQEPVAKATVILDDIGVLVGASVLSASADELLNYFAVAINERQDLNTIKHRIYAYPSIGSDMPFFY